MRMSKSSVVVMNLFVIGMMLLCVQAANAGVSNFEANPSYNGVSLSWTSGSTYNYTQITLDEVEKCATSSSSCSVGAEMGTQYTFVARSYKMVDGEREYGSGSVSVTTVTTLGSTLTSDRVLEPPLTGHHTLNSDLTIESGVRLTITTGTRIHVSTGSGVRWSVKGILVTNGVVITRKEDSGTWGSISVSPGGSLEMAYTEIGYAGIGGSFPKAAVRSSGSETSPNNIQLDHCNIHNGISGGISLSGNHENILLANSTVSVSSVRSFGLRITGNAISTTIENNTFSDNDIGSGIELSGYHGILTLTGNMISNSGSGLQISGASSHPHRMKAMEADLLKDTKLVSDCGVQAKKQNCLQHRILWT